MDVKIEKYYAYANQFIESYLQYLAAEKISDIKKKTITPGKFTGKLSMGLGQTVQNSAGNVSGFAGNMGFNGLYRVNDHTSVTGGIRYQEEVMRTPFASIRADAGIQNTFQKQNEVECQRRIQ